MTVTCGTRSRERAGETGGFGGDEKLRKLWDGQYTSGVGAVKTRCQRWGGNTCSLFTPMNCTTNMPRLHARQMYAAVMTTEDMSEAAEERGSNETSRRGSLQRTESDAARKAWVKPERSDTPRARNGHPLCVASVKKKSAGFSKGRTSTNLFGSAAMPVGPGARRCSVPLGDPMLVRPAAAFLVRRFRSNHLARVLSGGPPEPRPTPDWSVQLTCITKGGALRDFLELHETAAQKISKASSNNSNLPQLLSIRPAPLRLCALRR